MGDLVGQAGGRKGVTSVALSAPSFLSVAGSPITDAGTLAITLATQTANLVFAGPSSGGAATPTFRALVVGDIPVLDDTRLANAVILAPTVATRNVITLTDSATNTVVNVITLDHDSSGTPAAAFGTGLLLRGKSSTTSNRSMARFRAEWFTETDASRRAKIVLSVFNTTEWDALQIGLTTSNFANVAIGTVPSTSNNIPLTVYRSLNGQVAFLVQNDNTGVNNVGSINIGNGGSTLEISMHGANYTASGVRKAGFGVILGDGGGISFASTNASGRIGFFTGGSADANERVRIASDGKVGIGTTAAATQLHATITDTATNVVTNVLTIGHNASSPAASFGTGISFLGMSSNTVDRNMGRIRTEWTTAADASRASKMVFSAYAVGVETDAITILSDGKVGIGNSAPQNLMQLGDLISFGSGIAAGGEIQIGRSSTSSGYRAGQSSTNNLFFGWIYHATPASAAATLATYGYSNPLRLDGSIVSLQSQSGFNVGVGLVTATSKLDVNGDIETLDTGAYYMGDPTTDGSWRIVRSGTGLVMQRRESGSWVTKAQ